MGLDGPWWALIEGRAGTIRRPIPQTRCTFSRPLTIAVLFELLTQEVVLLLADLTE